MKLMKLAGPLNGKSLGSWALFLPPANLMAHRSYNSHVNVDVPADFLCVFAAQQQITGHSHTQSFRLLHRDVTEKLMKYVRNSESKYFCNPDQIRNWHAH